MIWIGIIIILVVFAGIITGLEKLKFGEHDDVSWPYISFGMYTWLHVIVLSVFWLLFGVACLFWWQPTQALRAYLFFHLFRSMTEIILVQSCLEPNYVTKILPAFDRISPKTAREVYSLIHCCIVVICSFFLFGIM